MLALSLAVSAVLGLLALAVLVLLSAGAVLGWLALRWLLGQVA